MPPARFLALLAVLAMPAAAQRAGGVYGVVLDTSDGGIGQAAVTIVNEDTGFRRAAETGPGGRYAVGGLEPGEYKITARKEGFRTVVRFGIRLGEAAAARVDFVLPVGSVEETITVRGTAPLIAHEDAATGTRILADEIARVPLNGRGLLTLLELTPGTIVVPATRGDPGQFTATGQRPNANSFLVDGMSANTGLAAGGVPAQSPGGTMPALSAFGSMDSLISVDALEEMRVQTSTSVAQFGRLPGASVELTSRAGTNEFHGTAAYRIRNELFSANDWFGNQAGFGKLPLRLQDIAGTLGGPVVRSRSFAFLSFQHVALLQPFVWAQPVPSIDTRNDAALWAQPALNLFPLAVTGPVANGLAEVLGRGSRPAGLYAGAARFDQALGSRVSLFGRYSDAPSNNQFGGLSVDALDLRSQSLTLAVNARLKPNTVLDARANESLAGVHSNWSPGHDCSLQTFFDGFFGVPPACESLVRFWIGGVGQLVSGREGDRRQRQFQTVETLGHRLGSHNLVVGSDYRSITAIRRDPTGTYGLIADDLAALADKRNLWFSQTPGQNASAHVDELSLWIQDTWQAARRVTVAAGLRWEYSPPLVAPPNPAGTTPLYYFLDPASQNIVSGSRQPLWRESYRDFAPRLGVAWQLTGDGKTVLRTGGGLYYDSSLSIATDVLNGGPLSISQLSSAIHAPFPSIMSYAFLPNLRLPEVAQWNATIERALGARDVVSLGYVGSEGWDLIRREAGGAGNNPTTLVALTTNHGHSAYHALELQYRRRMAPGLQATAAYTWSHAIDNDSSDSFLVWAAPGPGDHAASDFDLRHSLTAAVTYEPRFGKGWALDSIARVRSGFPITVLDADEYQGITLMNAFRPNLVWGQPLWIADANAPGGRRLNPAAFADAAAGHQGTLGRNAIEGFGMWQIDLALRREFVFKEKRRLQLRVEAFNLTNHASFADPVRYRNSPVFGQSVSMLNLMLGTGSPGSGLSPILQTGAPRSLQGTVRFQF
ncbi:MAG TPA: TonB-dependent receptor [Bryobacteraceae bacterium]|nr:TonB-dependent receptor [Bryobacteraceae bacterium]